jgi:F0F1-type ATP synthase assembly protein I
MTTGPSREGDRVQGQQRQLDQPGRVDEREARRQEPETEPERPSRPAREADGWQILSYMLGGMILYGGIGWLISHWTGIAVLFPLGMILGVGLSVAMIIFRFTRT